MADPFERELEELVHRYAQDLSRDITGLLLRRLGIESALPAARSRAPSATPPARRPGRPPATPSRPSAAPPGRKRKRSTAEQQAAAVSEVARVVDASRGLSVGEIERASGLPRISVATALKKLKDEGRVFMGGNRRFARYASTQAQADRASLDARGGA
jgi:hypothetical protein